MTWDTAPAGAIGQDGSMNDMPTWTPTMPEATPLADLPRAHTMFLDLLGQLRVGAEERADLTAMLREPWRRYHGAGHAGPRQKRSG